MKWMRSMRSMRSRNMLPALCAWLAVVLVGCTPAQEPATRNTEKPGAKQGGKHGGKQDAAALAKEVLETLKKHEIEVDLERKTITIPVVMNRPTDSIEYLLIHRNGKTHEAILISHARPSVLNSAFLLLGLEEGRNFELKDKDPMPSEADLRRGLSPYVEILPEGQQLFMTVSMRLEKGGTRVMAVEDLIADLHTGRAVAAASWIYLGGRMAQIYRDEPEVFMADVEGNLVSTCYMQPKNHLVTMVHERARDDQNWWLSAACPPPGTRMKLTFHLRKPKVVKEREQRIRKDTGKAASLPDPAARRVPGQGPDTRPASRKND